MNDPSRRAIRTLVQVGLVQALIQLWNAFAPQKLTIDQAAAITTVATPLVGFVQNLLEDNAVIPPLLKSPAADVVTVPDPPKA